MKDLLEICYYGYGILIFAALINWVGKKISLSSWYDLFGPLNFQDLNSLNILWLIVAYPLLLGLGVYILKRYISKIIK